jgi:molecular chaperone GrpE
MPKTKSPDVEELQTQLAEVTADLQRVQAEFINYKRRVQDERAELMDSATARVLRELLPARDSFDHELAARTAETLAGQAAAIDAIRAQFDQSLRGLGVERFTSAGRLFDPQLHEAVADAGGEGDYEVVANELQPGYRLGDRVLRPAMVRVEHVAEAPVVPENV